MNIILKQLFQQEIVNCIKNNEYSLYEEEGIFHISTTCLTSIGLKHRDSLIGLFLPFIERFNPSSIVALSEGIDQGVTILTTWIGLKSERPFFIYNLDEPRPLTEISSNLSDCMVLIPYLNNKKQFLSYLKFIINSGATPKLIICIFQETDEDFKNICNNKHIYFQTVFCLKNIILQLEEHRDFTEKLKRNRLKF